MDEGHWIIASLRDKHIDAWARDEKEHVRVLINLP
jgi:hypothetical protein